MKQLKVFTAFISTVIIMVSCQKQADLIPKSEAAKFDDVSINRTENEGESFGGGDKHVYTLSNQVSGNSVMEYERSSDGTITAFLKAMDLFLNSVYRSILPKIILQVFRSMALGIWYQLITVNFPLQKPNTLIIHWVFAYLFPMLIKAMAKTSTLTP